ncbi:MAG: type II toxin-antitoxin system RelE/ParE family toxin [Bacteroidetes bacterium]|nr:type II toxin-antitoxin system RelE/ParE family toxin [Bacteroidota bacterium]
MKYRLEVSPKVHLEVARIYLYREKNQGKGTGDRFLKALQGCYKDILSNPHGHQVRKAPYRHAMLHKLKYRVVYEVDVNTVYVYQVRHTSRKPSKKYGP